MAVASCNEDSACTSDYVAVGVTIAVILIIMSVIIFIWKKRDLPQIYSKQVSMLITQAVGSIVWVSALVITRYMVREDGNLFVSCYLWQVWLEGPFGYGLLISCHIARGYRLYRVFLGRQLPTLQSYQLVPLLILPWVCAVVVIQIKKPFGHNHCYGSSSWWIAISALHGAYISVLAISVWMIRNIRFEFNEFKELMVAVVMCVLFLGVWMGLFFSRTPKPDGTRAMFQEYASFIIIFLGNGTALCFSIFPVGRPLLAFIRNLQKKSSHLSMGHALGVPNSGLLNKPSDPSFRLDEPLEVLLEHKRFRQSFQLFADSRMAGEYVHFFDEVRELKKIPSTNTVARIYMAEHIIETYINTGSSMEINISHQMRSEIKNTKDLSCASLFDGAANEALNMLRLNVEHEFWQSPFCMDLQKKIAEDAEYGEQLEWMEPMSVNKVPLKRDSVRTGDNFLKPGSQLNGSQTSHISASIRGTYCPNLSSPVQGPPFPPDLSGRDNQLCHVG